MRSLDTDDRFGKLSLACGVCACMLFLVLAYVARLGVLYGGNLLRALDYVGWVRTQRTYIVELRASTVFSLNDANLVIWLTWLAFLLVLAAIAAALYARHNHEPTLYAAAGVTAATVGVGLLQPVAMLLFQAAAAGGLLWIKQRERQSWNPPTTDQTPGKS